jgi:phospholipase/lecithinase/hemolysin
MVFPHDPGLPKPIARLVVFGDSLSDSGNLKRRLLIFPGSPYWLGRFANGPNWADYLGERTGIAVQNHSYGGAVAVKHENVPADDVIAAIQKGAQFFLTGSLDGQVRDYLERDLDTGVIRSPEDTLYVVWGGANDYISKEPFTGEIGTLLDSPEGQAGYKRIVKEAVAALADQVRRLHDAGARRFLMINLPNLGETPIILQNESYKPPGRVRSDGARRLELSRKLGELTTFHNRELRRAIVELRKQLPDARIGHVDSEEAVERIFEGRSPDAGGGRFDYGFALREQQGEVRDARRRVYFQNRCFNASYLGTSDASKVCAEARGAMFWDVIHPTTYTHCWISFFVQRELAREGWLAKAHSLASQRAYCASRSDPVF